MKEVIITLLLAMTPISEVRGAIPYALASGISFPWVIVLPIVGNIFVIPWLLILLQPMVSWIKTKVILKKFQEWLVQYQNNSLKRVTKHNRTILLALFLFVAIPLPSTGAYSGALVAALLQLPKRESFAAISLGVVVAAAIVYIASQGVIHII